MNVELICVIYFSVLFFFKKEKQSTLTAENDVELFLHIRFLVVSQYCAYFFMSVGYSEQSLIILKSLYCEDVMKCFKKLSLTMQLQSY